MPLVKRKKGRGVDWVKLDLEDVDGLTGDLAALASEPPPRGALENMLFCLAELCEGYRDKKTKTGKATSKPVASEQDKKKWKESLEGLLDWADELNQMACLLRFKRRLAGKEV